MRIVRLSVDLTPVRELRLRRPIPPATRAESVTTVHPSREPGAAVPAPTRGLQAQP